MDRAVDAKLRALSVLEQFNREGEASLVFLSKILQTVGEAPPLLPMKIAGLGLDAVLKVLVPENQLQNDDAMAEAFNSLKGEINNIKKVVDSTLKLVIDLKHRSHLERIHTKYVNMLRHPDWKLWASEFAQDKNNFEDTLAAYHPDNIRSHLVTVYETQCNEDILHLTSSYNQLMTTRFMYFLIVSKYYEFVDAMSGDDRQRMVCHEMEQFNQDVRNIENIMREVDPFFHAVQALNKVQHKYISPVKPAYMPTITNEASLSSDLLYNKRWRWKGELYRPVGDSGKPHYAKFVGEDPKWTYTLKIAKKWNLRNFSRNFNVVKGLARVEHDNGAVSIGNIAADGRWTGGVLTMDNHGIITYSEWQSNMQVATKNMIFVWEERAWR